MGVLREATGDPLWACWLSPRAASCPVDRPRVKDKRAAPADSQRGAEAAVHPRASVNPSGCRGPSLQAAPASRNSPGCGPAHASCRWWGPWAAGPGEATLLPEPLKMSLSKATEFWSALSGSHGERTFCCAGLGALSCSAGPCGHTFCVWISSMAHTQDTPSPTGGAHWALHSDSQPGYKSWSRGLCSRGHGRSGSPLVGTAGPLELGFPSPTQLVACPLDECEKLVLTPFAGVCREDREDAVPDGEHPWGLPRTRTCQWVPVPGRVETTTVG